MIKFLVPVNFAPHTVNTIHYCAALAQHVKGEITLLYCYTHLLSSTDEKSKNTNVISSYEDAMLALEKLKKQVLEHFKGLNNSLIKLKISEGYPEDHIPLISQEYEPDLIVMGTKSKGETIKELLGSVTLDVIKKVMNPVMVVPNNYKFILSKLTNILFVTDFVRCEYTSLHKLVRLVGAFDTKIYSTEYLSDSKGKADVEKLKDYSEYCKSTYRNQAMVCDYICGGDIIEASQQYIKSNNIDLMAITRKKRSLISQMLHPGVTKKILFNAEIPTLFFHQ